MADKTTISLEINPENFTDKEIETLMSLVEKSSGNGNDRCPKPKYGEYYWYINSAMKADIKMWTDCYMDEERYNAYNYYLSREDCEFEEERLKVISELKNYSFEPNWNDFSQKKYFFYYDYKNNFMYKTYSTYARYNELTYFMSMDVLEQSIKSVGEDRIKKYLFGVK